MQVGVQTGLAPLPHQVPLESSDLKVLSGICVAFQMVSLSLAVFGDQYAFSPNKTQPWIQHSDVLCWHLVRSICAHLFILSLIEAMILC